MFLRRFNLLNLLLVCVIVALGLNIYRTFSDQIPPKKKKHKFLKVNKNEDLYDISNKENIYSSYYNVIVDKNLFRPQRTEWKPPPPPPPPIQKKNKKKKVKQKVQLNINLRGVVLLDDGRRVALVEGSFKRYREVEVITQHISGNPTKGIKYIEVESELKDHRLFVNDFVETFKVTEILPDKLVLAGNSGEKVEIFLKDVKEENNQVDIRNNIEKKEFKVDTGETIFLNIKSLKPFSSKKSPSKNNGEGGSKKKKKSIKKPSVSKKDQKPSANATKQHISGN